MLREITNVIPTVLLEDSYDHFKKQCIDAVIHVNGDAASYVDAYKSFLISSAIKAPLVSSPNIAFDSVLEDGVDLFIADTLHAFTGFIHKTKDTSIRVPMIYSFRKKTC